MELTTARRGTFVTMNYLSPTTVEMLWEIPLSELIMDYFDKLKSNTKATPRSTTTSTTTSPRSW